MNICLIYSEKDEWAFGMRSVSAFLKKAGFNTRLIFLDTEAILSDIELSALGTLTISHDIIGVSSLSKGHQIATQVLQYLRLKKHFTVWGGLHATLNPCECIDYADVVCIGEGEEFMLDLVHRIRDGKEWRNLPNASFKDKNSCVTNPIRPLINNLDDLPLYDFSFDDEWHLTKKGFKKVSDISDTAKPLMFNGARGCAYYCTYCSNAKLKKLFEGKGRYVRKMNVAHYIEQLVALKKKFPKSKYYYFLDEDFFARPISYLTEFAERYKEKVGLPFECMASPLNMSEEKISILADAGLWRVRMGIESGSDRTKKEVYNRPMPNEAVLKSAHIITKDSRVIPLYFIIIANPYENENDIVHTINLLRNLPYPYYIHVFNLVFFPGTLLYEKAVNDGLIYGIDDSGYEIDFRGGLHYKDHTWKKKNLYLNGIIFLLEGKSTSFRIGLIPRFLFSVILHKRIIILNEKLPHLIQFLISAKSFILSIRSSIAIMVQKVIGDPTSVYDFGKFFRRYFQKNQTKRRYLNSFYQSKLNTLSRIF